MAVEQKQAVFILVVLALTLVVFLVLLPFAGKGAWGALGLLGIIGLSPRFFRKLRDSAEPLMDERDKFIAEKATWAAALAAYESVILACMATWLVHMIGRKGMISIHVLPLIVWCEGVIFLLVRSVVVLALYRRTGGDGEE